MLGFKSLRLASFFSDRRTDKKAFKAERWMLGREQLASFSLERIPLPATHPPMSIYTSFIFYFAKKHLKKVEWLVKVKC